MKHCKSCEYCRLDLVTQYVQGVKLYRCDKTEDVIKDPFWQKCEYYKKDSFSSKGLCGWISSQLHNT